MRRDRPSRQNAHAHPGAHEGDDRVGPLDLRHAPWLDAARLQQRREDQSTPRGHGIREQMLVGELLHRHEGHVRETVARRDDDDQLVLEERQVAQSRIAPGAIDDADVDAAIQERLDGGECLPSCAICR